MPGESNQERLPGGGAVQEDGVRMEDGLADAKALWQEKGTAAEQSGMELAEAGVRLVSLSGDSDCSES